MIKRKHWEILYKAVLLVMVILLASEPMLVAAKPQQVDPRQQAIDSFTASGDVYLTNVAETLSLSTGLVNSVSAIRTTSLTQLSETAIAQTRVNALKAAESSAIALGSIDDLADSIESFGGNLPVAFDPFQRAAQGLPQELRDDLIQEAGLSSADVDAISSGMDDILLARQNMAANGMPAEIAAQLLQAGFSQAEIDQLALAAGNRGLANTGLTTSLAQFRASQDEWADVRTQMLILNVQLLGYQIGVRQANGIEPRAVTEAELQEIAEDELRLLVHVAHLQELWGSDPNLNVGEGDWWFIEHYAGRAAERLDALIIETQNRALVQDLFVLQEMRLLALSAKHGDANYVKAELDGLGKLLSFLVGDETFISRQRDELNGLTYLAARLASHASLRETVQWHVADNESAHAAKNARLRMDAAGVQELSPLFGVVAEQNETNNIKTLLFMGGASYIDQAMAGILREIFEIATDLNQMSVAEIALVILNGDTDNSLLITANMIIGFIPVVNVLSDIFALIAADGNFMKAVLLFALFCDVGESLALIPGLQIAATAFIGGAVAAVVRVLFRNADVAFKGILNGLRLADAFNVVVDLVKVVSNYITTAIHSVNNAIQVLQDILTGGLKLWDNFVAFVKRVGAGTLRKLGFDQGSLLVGRILNLGVDLSDEALVSLKHVADDLVSASVDLSDEAAEGLGVAAKMMGGDDLKRFVQKLGNACAVTSIHGSFKLARPVAACSAEILNKYFTSLQKISLDSDVFSKTQILFYKIGEDDFAKLVEKYASDPDNLDRAKYIFGVLGNPSVSTDAVKTAMKQGPEAAEALSFWNMSLLTNESIVKELAQRAGKDAVALGKLDELTNLTPSQLANLDQDPAKSIIAEIAANSTHGNGSVFVLGRFTEYDGGYVLYGRFLENTGVGSRYYHSHPEIYNTILNRFPSDPNTRDNLLWAINKRALDTPTGSRVPFEYSLLDALADKKTIEDIWDLGKQLKASGASDSTVEDAFDIIIKRDNDGEIPGRMRELKLLFFSGYVNYAFDASSTLFRITP